MNRIGILLLLVTGLSFATPINVGIVTLQHQDGGVGWFSVEQHTNQSPTYRTTSNIRLDNVKLIVQTNVGGLFEYALFLGAGPAGLVPAGEPGIVWEPTNPGVFTVEKQSDPLMKYFTRGFDPTTSCASQAECADNAPNGTLSTDLIVRAVLAFSVTKLDSAWMVDTPSGPLEFIPNQPEGYVYYQELVYQFATDHFDVYPFTGTPNSWAAYLSVDGVVPGDEPAIPEPATTGLVLSGIALIVMNRRKLMSRN